MKRKVTPEEKDTILKTYDTVYNNALTTIKEIAPNGHLIRKAVQELKLKIDKRYQHNTVDKIIVGLKQLEQLLLMLIKTNFETTETTQVLANIKLIGEQV